MVHFDWNCRNLANTLSRGIIRSIRDVLSRNNGPHEYRWHETSN